MTTKILPGLSSLWDMRDPAGSQARFVNLLPDAEASGNVSYLVELLAQIGRAQALQRNFGAAHASLDQARRILDSGQAHEQRRAMACYLLERGRVYTVSSHEDLAEDYFLEAYEMGLGCGEEALAIDAAHMLGISSAGTESMDWLCRALKHAEQGIDALARRWQSPLLALIAGKYKDSGDIESALQMQERARQCRVAQFLPEPLPHGDSTGKQPVCPECLPDGSLLVSLA